ncbi:MAG: prolipoprotein diacylglyceryl transferase [Candidatus Pacearchaeota archaeon]|nr:MAG: prolipoprotein diacylglyceryl transferase [Candidatus Pacearchaeota archaeon]
MIPFEPVKAFLQIGPFSILPWGVMFVTGFLAAMFLIFKEAKKKGIDEKHIYIIALLILIGAIIGPRLFYIFEHLSYFLASPGQIFELWKGGETSYGAFLGVLFVWLYVRKQRDIKFTQILDLVAPYILLAMAITRIGCFLNWCCYGLPSSLPWAIQVPGNIPRHPTQIYELLYSLIGFFVLLKFKNIKEKGKETKFKSLLKKPGALFFSFLMFYSFFRFLNDFLREYENYFLGLALSQWIVVVLFLFGFVMLNRPIRRR